jgi:hypothetical protein
MTLREKGKTSRFTAKNIRRRILCQRKKNIKTDRRNLDPKNKIIRMNRSHIRTSTMADRKKDINEQTNIFTRIEKEHDI